MLKTQGINIVDENGKQIVLKGFNIGNWMMFENFMFGFAGVEQQFRTSVEKYAGKEKAEYFFDKYLYASFNEDDIKYLKDMGCNCLRIPFSYKYFESDMNPYVYDENGFKHLDRIIEICKQYEIYILLDLHCVQGYQSPDWHCDNLTGEVRLYTEGSAQDRFKKLWVHIANHYKNERIIAAYDLMNEPCAQTKEQIKGLNKVYEDVAAAVRKVDSEHILVISGNRYGTSFNEMNPPFMDNLVYTCHYYLDAATSTRLRYPGRFGNLICDKRIVELQMDMLTDYMRKYNVPCWVGEFGVRLSYKNYTEDRLRIFEDQMNAINDRDYSWSLWTYKDLCHIGTVNCREDSPWINFVKDILELKQKYNCDMNFKHQDCWDLSRIIGARNDSDFEDVYDEITDDINKSIKRVFCSYISDLLGKKFADLTYDQIDELVSSFEFRNCKIDERRLGTITRCLK